jgi:hypothetical protein
MESAAGVKISWGELWKGDEAALRDHGKVFELFNGRGKIVGKRVFHEYLEGEEERDARRVLARLLREGRLHPIFHIVLAEMFDPVRQSGIGRERHKLTFTDRTYNGRDLMIGLDLAMAAHVGQKLESAVSDAAHKYGVKVRTVTRAWSKFKNDPLTAGSVRAVTRPSKVSK